MIGVKSTNIDFAANSLNQFAARVESLAGLGNKLGEIAKEQTVQRFYDQKGPDGLPWAELQPSTIRNKHGRTDKLISGKRRSGDASIMLVNSITYSSIDNGVFIHSSLPNHRVAPHQYGDAHRNLPKRAIFGASTNDMSVLGDATMEWLEGLF